VATRHRRGLARPARTRPVIVATGTGGPGEGGRHPPGDRGDPAPGAPARAVRTRPVIVAPGIWAPWRPAHADLGGA